MKNCVFYLLALILITNSHYASGQRIQVENDLQGMVDSWSKGLAKNGLACGVAVLPATANSGLAIVNHVINTTTNYIQGLLNLPDEALADVRLYDLMQKEVPRSAFGEHFGMWTNLQIETWFGGFLSRRASQSAKSGSITYTIFPLSTFQLGNPIEIAKLFKVRQSGEYTLHVRTRIAKTRLDSSGKIVLDIYWLPEAISKLSIQSVNGVNP